MAEFITPSPSADPSRGYRPPVFDFDYSVQLSADWAATEPGYRQKLRAALARFTGCPSTLNRDNVFRYDKGYFSISHSRTTGGFALSTHPIGLDIESSDRALTQKAYLRISTEEEREFPLTPIELWVAKEAAFKAVCSSLHEQPSVAPNLNFKTISQIEILSWERVATSGDLHFAYNISDFNWLSGIGKGLIKSQNHLTLGIATVIS